MAWHGMVWRGVAWKSQLNNECYNLKRGNMYVSLGGHHESDPPVAPPNRRMTWWRFLTRLRYWIGGLERRGERNVGCQDRKKLGRVGHYMQSALNSHSEQAVVVHGPEDSLDTKSPNGLLLNQSLPENLDSQ